jgi:hypothetical protein
MIKKSGREQFNDDDGIGLDAQWSDAGTRDRQLIDERAVMQFLKAVEAGNQAEVDAAFRRLDELGFQVFGVQLTEWPGRCVDE